MKEEKCNSLIIIIVFAVLNINFHGSAFSTQTLNNSLQWFPSLAAYNDTVYIIWADERNGNYSRIMNNIPHKSGDIYLSKGSFQDGWIFDKNIRINEIKGTTGHGSPSIAVDNDNIYTAWEDKPGVIPQTLEELKAILERVRTQEQPRIETTLDLVNSNLEESKKTLSGINSTLDSVKGMTSFVNKNSTLILIGLGIFGAVVFLDLLVALIVLVKMAFL